MLQAGCGHDEFGTLGDMTATSMAKCINKCLQHQNCRSIEWIPSEAKCELNFERIPLENATIGYMFCSRIGNCKSL